MFSLHPLKKARRIDHEGECEEVCERWVGALGQVETFRFTASDGFGDLAVFAWPWCIEDCRH